MNGRLAVTLENPKILRLSEGGHDDARSEGGHDDASEGIDRISNLPESILHHIFSLVEDTLDVITASAVSRKWRYIWLSMPSLTFSTFHKIWSDKRKTLSSHKVNEEFKDFVNWVLMSQNSSITVQSFCLCGYIHESDDYTLYRWMSVLADRKLQELGLMVFSDGPVELPHFLVSCESLVYFKFIFGLHEVLKLPSSAGFVGLNMLCLMNVKLLDCVSFRTFISNCPVLEHLNLLACVFSDMKILDIASVSLKSLVIDNSYPDPGGDGLRNCELKVTCPGLVSFYYNSPLAKDFLLQDLNSLEDIFLSIDSLTEYGVVNDCHHIMHKVFKGISNITVLKLPAALEMVYVHF